MASKPFIPLSGRIVVAFIGILLGLQSPLAALTIRSIEFQGFNYLNEHMVQPYLTLEIGRHYSPQELNEAIAWSIARAESSPMIDFLVIEDFRNDDGSVDLIIEVLERAFPWTFFAGNLYAEAGRDNLIGPGSLVQGALGYNLQRLRVDRPPTGPVPIGLAGEAAHRFPNPDTFRSRLSFELTPYLKLTPFIHLDLSPRFRLYRDWNRAENPVSELSLGTAIRANYRYLQRRTPLALDARTAYRFILQGPGTGTHILGTDALLDIRILAFLHTVLEGYAAFQTGEDTVELLPSGIPGNPDTGRIAWRGSLSIPITLVSGGRTLQIDFGITAQVHLGATGTTFNSAAHTLAVGGGPYMTIEFPVDIRLSPELYYLLPQEQFAFRFVVEASR